MIWLAMATTLACITLLAWQAQHWLAPALLRHRERYAREAGSRLEELFVFVEPARLWAGAVALAALAAALTLMATSSGVAAALAGVAAWRVPRRLVKALHRRRVRRFEQQLPMALLMLASALRAGVALAPALRQVVADGGGPLAQEFSLMLREQRLGVPWEEALEHLSSRMAAESTTLVVAAMRLSARTGGNLAEALDSIAQTLRARLQLQDRVRVLTSQGRLQAWIVGALPLLLLAVLERLEPDSMAPLWHTPQGWGVLALVATLETLGVLLIRRVVRVDV
ncbi:MAG: type II secretion system F family protein [Achromobacter sp.]|uniref:type II secretion system F family protein n=1 Tax=Achromobacter sp. TaxID=134375 RepID=UPI003D014FE0